MRRSGLPVIVRMVPEVVKVVTPVALGASMPVTAAVTVQAPAWLVLRGTVLTTVTLAVPAAAMAGMEMLEAE